MTVIFKLGEEASNVTNGLQFVNIGWQKQVEEGLDINGLTNFGYISGYKNSADDLLDIALKNGSLESYIFPIVFLYRQYLELLLKNILAKLPKKNSYLGAPHDLSSMWKHISKIFKRDRVLKKKSIEFVSEVIKEFHKIDPKSSNFRYFLKYGNKLTLNEEIVVDTKTMKEAIDDVDTILYGTYGGI